MTTSNSPSFTILQFDSGLFSDEANPGQGVDLQGILAACNADQAACDADRAQCDADVATVAGVLASVKAAGSSAINALNTAVTAAENTFNGDIATATGTISALSSAATTAAAAAAVSAAAAGVSASAASNSATASAASATAAAASATAVAGEVASCIADATAAASSATLAQAAASAAEAAAVAAQGALDGKFPASAGYLYTDTSGAVVGGALGVDLTAPDGTLNVTRAPLMPSICFSGKPGAGQEVDLPIPVAFSFGANIPFTSFYVGTPAQTPAAFTVGVSRAGVKTALGTLVVTNSNVVATVTAWTGEPGDALIITAPATQDATLANFAVTFYLSRT